MLSRLLIWAQVVERGHGDLLALLSAYTLVKDLQYGSEVARLRLQVPLPRLLRPVRCWLLLLSVLRSGYDHLLLLEVHGAAELKLLTSHIRSYAKLAKLLCSWLTNLGASG